MCDPMKPAPPVMRYRIVVPPVGSGIIVVARGAG